MVLFGRLTKLKSHVKHRKYELFSKKVELLGYTIFAASLGVV